MRDRTVHTVNGQVVHDSAPTPAGQADATIRQQAEQALTTNRAYVAKANPTAAETTAQVKALSRHQNGIIRLLLDRLDGTD